MSDTATPSNTTPERKSSRWTALYRWIDSDYFPNGPQAELDKPDVLDWRRAMSFVFIHAGCLAVFLVGWSWTAVWAAVALYFVRMFAVTGIYHRYFSHRTYKTSRAGQLILAVLGNTAVQRGALWWAATHRHHHLHSDDEHDAHSPRQHGFLWSHIGWMTSSRNFPTDYSRIKDLARFPELVFLNRFDLLVPALFGAACWGVGSALHAFRPDLGVTGAQLFIWVFFISTTFLLHGTLFINSLAHVYGSRRYETTDTSRNSFLLALITLGEGWHNNHHHCMTTVRQGFYWYEIDVSFYILKMLSWTGFVWDLRPVPEQAYVDATARGMAPLPVVVPAIVEEMPTTAFAKITHEAVRLRDAAKSETVRLTGVAKHEAARFSEAAHVKAAQLSEAAHHKATQIGDAAKAGLDAAFPAPESAEA
jgi:stearoyl-CoA desaturase (delta-9 desaturase)